MHALPGTRLRAGGRRRAATMIEFVLILPILLFVILFTVDVGNIILVNGAMQDVAYSSARAGAQVGGASLMPNGTYPCGTQKSSANCTQGASANAFKASVANVPAYSSKQANTVQMQILSGGRCTATAIGGRSDNYVSIRVTYQHKLITPGLGALLNLAGANADTSGVWKMGVTAVSRCEVVR